MISTSHSSGWALLPDPGWLTHTVTSVAASGFDRGKWVRPGAAGGVAVSSCRSTSTSVRLGLSVTLTRNSGLCAAREKHVVRTWGWGLKALSTGTGRQRSTDSER